MINTLSVTTHDFLLSLQVAAIGILMVFALLIILILILQSTRYIKKWTKPANDKIKDKWQNRKSKKSKETQTETTVPTPTVSVDEKYDSNDETIAAIIGAINIYLSNDTEINPDARFVVRNIKKFNNRRI